MTEPNEAVHRHFKVERDTPLYKWLRRGFMASARAEGAIRGRTKRRFQEHAEKCWAHAHWCIQNMPDGQPFTHWRFKRVGKNSLTDVMFGNGQDYEIHEREEDECLENN